MSYRQDALNSFDSFVPFSDQLQYVQRNHIAHCMLVLIVHRKQSVSADICAFVLLTRKSASYQATTELQDNQKPVMLAGDQ